MDFDYFVIGAGSGGVASARRAASHGASVAVAEEWDFGGTCVNRGCVPKKLMVFASQLAYDMATAQGYGYRVERSFDWSRFRELLHRELVRLKSHYRKILDDNQIKVFPARARVAGPNQVEVAGRTVTARHILVAVGGKPTRVTFPGHELSMVSDDVFNLEALPKRLLVLGSGFIGVEMSCIFNGLGSQVTFAYRSPYVLPGFDEDVRMHLSDQMSMRGVRLLPGTRPIKLEKTDGGFLYTCEECEPIECDAVLSALGRKPNTAGLGLAEAGVEMRADGSLVVDEHYATSVPSIHSVGDCIGKVQFTPVAIAEGRALAETLFNDNPSTLAYDVLPQAVYAQPAVGMVGLSEEAARQVYGQVDIFRTTFRPMRTAFAGQEDRALLKLVVDRASDRVVGVHLVAPEAPELIQALGVAMRASATKHDFDTTIAVHPTLAEELVLMREPVPV